MSGLLRWALVFLVIAIIAGIFGFTGIAVDSAWFAQVLFFLFLIVFAIFLVLNLVGGRGSPPV